MQTRPAQSQWQGPELLAVFIGGGVGTLLRFVLVEVLPSAPDAWPWNTFIANVLACLLLGWAIRQHARGWGGDARLALIGSGFCGGLSTFSTLQLELYRMFDAGAWPLALLYIAASLVCGWLAVGLARRSALREEDVA